MWTEFIDTYQPLFAGCRSINPFLAIAAMTSLGYRLGPALLRAWLYRKELTIYQRQERDARLLFAGYLLAAGLGAAQAISLDQKAGPVSVLLTLLHLGTILVMVRWKNQE